MTTRRRLWRWHAWLGWAAGVPLALVGLSGSILVFRPELERLTCPRYFVCAPGPAAGAGAVGLDRALDRFVAQARGVDVEGLTLPREPTETVQLRCRWTASGREATVFLNPHTGECQGPFARDWCPWTGALVRFHYTLLGADPGEIAVALIGLGFVALAGSGLRLNRIPAAVLWRQTFRRSPAPEPRRVARSRRHRLLGVVSVGLALPVIVTGVCLNRFAFERVWNSWSHPAREGAAPAVVPAAPPAPWRPLAPLLRSAARAVPGLVPRAVELSVDEATVYGRVPGANPLASDFGSHVTLGRADGVPRAVTDARHAPWPAVLADSCYPLHAGLYGGSLVRAVYAAVGLLPGALLITGLSVRRTRRRAGARAGGGRPADPGPGRPPLT